MHVAWLCGHSKTVCIALCIVFFVHASTVTTSLQQLLTLLSVWLNVLFCVSHFRSYYSLLLSYNGSWGRGWVPVKPVYPPPVFLYWPFQGGTSVVVTYCCLFLLSVYMLWFSYYASDILQILGSWMTSYRGKSCSFGLPRVTFVNCRQFMYLVISLLVLRAGCGIWLYQFLIIAYLFTLWQSQKSSTIPIEMNFIVSLYKHSLRMVHSHTVYISSARRKIHSKTINSRETNENMHSNSA